MLDYEKFTVNGKLIDFAIISGDLELIIGNGGKVLILRSMDAATDHKQAEELTRLQITNVEHAIMFPDPQNKTQFDWVEVDLQTYTKIKDFSVRALTVN